MSEETPVRQEFPFIRPRLSIWYAVPAIGTLRYLRDLNRIKGISWRDMLKQPFLESNLKDWLTLGVSTWPAAENPRESIESTKTAFQNTAILGYQMITTLTIAIEALKLIQS
jgi:hypothetical protein